MSRDKARMIVIGEMATKTACLLAVIFFGVRHVQATTYPYFYLKQQKGILCFDQHQSDMKMTPTGCCLLPVTTFQDEKIFIGTGKCYGSDADFQTLRDGSVLKIVNKDKNCAPFIINDKGYLQFKHIISSISRFLCIRGIREGPKLRHCPTENSNYIFYANGTCPVSKADSSLIKHVTELKAGSSYFLTNDGSKLTLAQKSSNKRPTELKLYSNNQLWAVSPGGSEYCLHVDHKEKLQDLDGLDVKLAGGEQGCMGQRFTFRGDRKTYELFGTNYCWVQDGSNLILRKCDQAWNEFTEILKNIVQSTSSSLRTTESTVTEVPALPSQETHFATSSAQTLQFSMSTSVPATRRTTVEDRSSISSDYALSPSSASSTPSVLAASRTTVEDTSSLSSNYALSPSSSASPAPSVPATRHTTVEDTISMSSNYALSPSISVISTPSRTATNTQITELKTYYSSETVTTTPALKTSSVSETQQMALLDFEISSTISTNSLSTSPVLALKNIEVVHHNLFLANPGQQCSDFCRSKQLYCSSRIDTGNSNDIFMDNGVQCKTDESRRIWKEEYDPSYDIRRNICAGYLSVNETVQCRVNSFNNKNIRRLCKCVTSDEEDSLSPWALWSDCTKSCNSGTKTRRRFCIGDNCSGMKIETISCNNHSCPINGGLSKWTEWSGCSSSCGGGRMNRSRSCNNPFPKHGGLNCYGAMTMTRICNVQRCPIHGKWSAWTEWSACDKPCNNGWFRRWRYCTNPHPIFGGRTCPGEADEKRSCNAQKCPSENVTATDIKFLGEWKNEMAIKGSQAFDDFRHRLASNLKLMLKDGMQNSLYSNSYIQYLRKGSIIATFTVSFAGIDSLQLLLLQDAINDDKCIGKLKVTSSNNTIFVTGNPSEAPSNFSVIALSATSLRATWDKVHQNATNGSRVGYILFYREKSLSSQPYQSIATYNLTVTLRGLKTYTEYVLRVLSYNDKGNGLSSESVSAFTGEAAPSTAPKSIEATANSPFSAIVAWSNLPQWLWNGKPLGCIVRYDDLNGHNGNQTVFFPESSCTLQKLTPLTTYIIEVCAATLGGAGPCQRTDVTTLRGTPSKPPGHINVDSLISHNSMKVSWQLLDSTHANGDLRGYKVIYKLKKISGRTVAIDETKTVTVHPSLNATRLTGLQPNSQYQIYVVAFNEIGDGVISEGYFGDTCTCPETLYTNFAASAPYIYTDTDGNRKGLIIDLLQNMTSHACGKCNRDRQTTINVQSNGKNYWAEKRSLKEMKMDIDDGVHISFPLFASSEVISYNGHQFVPLFSHPGVIYYIIKDTLATQVKQMTKNILNTWPILILNLLLVILSGIIIWALDASNNDQDFPKPFIRGTGSGIYWAFITMGTHGYGDLTPKGIGARLFTVVWILVGLVNFSILTGALTTALTTITVYDNTLIYGVQVAAVQDSEAYRIGIHRNAKINTKEQYKSVEDVARALKSRQVRGALVDVYTAATRGDLFKHPDIVAKNNIRYPNYFGLVLSGDVKNAAPAFRSYMHENADKFLQEVQNKTSKLEIDRNVVNKISILNSGSESLQKALISVAVLFIITLLIGWGFHWCTLVRKAKFVSNQQPSSKEIEDLCNESIALFANSIQRHIGSLFDRHLTERVKLAKKRKVNLNMSMVCKAKRNAECYKSEAAHDLANDQKPRSKMVSVTSL